jgi:hypothetical protein
MTMGDMLLNVHWPRCGCRFAASRTDIHLYGWQTCALPWGHWFSRDRARRRHEGPLETADVQPRGGRP